MVPSRRRLGVMMRLVTAAYVLALAMLPFAHHDLACHLKSSTHCSTCHIGTSADESRPDPAVAAMSLAEAGRAEETSPARIATRAPSPSSGRSPPPAISAVS